MVVALSTISTAASVRGVKVCECECARSKINPEEPEAAAGRRDGARRKLLKLLSLVIFFTLTLQTESTVRGRLLMAAFLLLSGGGAGIIAED